MKFHHQLKKLRLRHNYSQKEMAAILNMGQPAYCRYETGKIEPRCSLLLRVSQHFNVSLNWLVGEKSPQQKTVKKELQ